MLRDWLDAGGIARAVVEFLQNLVAQEYCESNGNGACQTTAEGYYTTCSLLSSTIYYDLWETPSEFDYFEWIHTIDCCCVDHEVEEPSGGPTTGPGDDEPV
jgi:hypothetical protein